MKGLVSLTQPNSSKSYVLNIGAASFVIVRGLIVAVSYCSTDGKIIRATVPLGYRAMENCKKIWIDFPILFEVYQHRPEFNLLVSSIIATESIKPFENDDVPF